MGLHTYHLFSIFDIDIACSADKPYQHALFLRLFSFSYWSVGFLLFLLSLRNRCKIQKFPLLFLLFVWKNPFLWAEDIKIFSMLSNKSFRIVLHMEVFHLFGIDFCLWCAIEIQFHFFLIWITSCPSTFSWKVNSFCLSLSLAVSSFSKLNVHICVGHMHNLF